MGLRRWSRSAWRAELCKVCNGCVGNDPINKSDPNGHSFGDAPGDLGEGEPEGGYAGPDNSVGEIGSELATEAKDDTAEFDNGTRTQTSLNRRGVRGYSGPAAGAGTNFSPPSGFYDTPAMSALQRAIRTRKAERLRSLEKVNRPGISRFDNQKINAAHTSVTLNAKNLVRKH